MFFLCVMCSSTGLHYKVTRANHASVIQTPAGSVCGMNVWVAGVKPQTEYDSNFDLLVDLYH